ncbi:MAG: tetratricopeptide repeat protein [Spirochaetia bacterium]|jgi:tetratricopeptide (TPR) repeat protein
MRNVWVIASWILLVLPAAAGGADPTVESLLSLKADGMNEGDRLQNAMYCLTAGRQARDDGKFGTALDLFNKCLELNSEEAEAHFQKGILFGDERVGLRKQAISELLLFLAANPANGHAAAELGHQYMMLGRFTEAEEQYKLAIARDPGDPYAWGVYGVLLIGFTDRVQEGVDLEKAAAVRGSDEPWFQMSLAWGYYRLGKYAESRASANKAIAALRKYGRGENPIDEMNQLLRMIEGK